MALDLIEKLEGVRPEIHDGPPEFPEAPTPDVEPPEDPFPFNRGTRFSFTRSCLRHRVC